MENIETPINPSDDRAARKAEQSARDRKTANKAKLMSLLRLFGIAALVIGVIGGLIWIGEQQDGNISQPSPLDSQVTELDHVKGAATAPLTLIEYGDFQCPTCATYAAVVKELSLAYPDDLRVVYRHFPLESIHPNAELAARTAEAAAGQNKFWEMHDLLFGKQSEWSKLSNPRDTFIGYAESLGLDTEQFKTDLDSKEVKGRVTADYKSGVAARVSGTPTFYLNGEALENPRGLEAFKALIDAKLPAQPQE